jgi:hypothetical protein
MRVEFKTDARNEQSRAALAGIGRLAAGVARDGGRADRLGELRILFAEACFGVFERPKRPSLNGRAMIPPRSSICACGAVSRYPVNKIWKI